MLCPVPRPNGCSVCGPRRCIQYPNNRFGFPGEFGYDISCATLQQGGFDGLVDPVECQVIVPFVEFRCGCDYFVPSIPAPVPFPTPSQMVYPTLRPPPRPTQRPPIASGGSMRMGMMGGKGMRSLGATKDLVVNEKIIDNVIRGVQGL